MIDISTAISKLGIDDWVLDGDPTNESEFNSSFRKIVGVNPNGTAKKSENPNDFGITWSEVKAKQTELQNAEAMRLLREERNRRLTETDWKDLPSYPGTDQNDWRTYRQALRDLPSTASPSLDDNGQLTNVTWPTKPE